MDALFALPAWLPALAPAWPLALTLALVLPPWRRPVLALACWAGLPALLIAIAAPPAEQPLPGLLLGASLQLDDAGRWLLAAVALLWLAGGWLAADWLSLPRRAAAFLLAMAGALWLPLTGDLPSLLAASVLAAYPLYALLGGGRGARALLVSVVIADLLILEALLLLAKGAAGLDFVSLRAALAEAHERTVPLALLLIGFGAKAGVTGLCYWLVPVLTDARARHLGPTVAFALVAGVLPLLRLLPLGEAQWPAVAALLPWLALAGCAWSMMAGLLQAAPRAVTAYTLAALATLWLGLLGLRLEAPEASTAVSAAFPAMLALAGLGLTALLLASDVVGRRGRIGARLLAVLLIAPAVLGTTLLTPAASEAAQWPMVGSIGCVGILLGASVTAALGSGHQPRADRASLAGTTLVIAGFGLAALDLASRSGGLPPIDGSHGDWVIAPTAALLTGLALGPVAVRTLAQLPRVPAGDLFTVIEPAAIGLVRAWRQLGRGVELWRDRFYQRLALARPRADAPPGMLGRIEALLRRWSTATLLLLVAAAAAALLARVSWPSA
jgi:hypothetical protein